MYLIFATIIYSQIFSQISTLKPSPTEIYQNEVLLTEPDQFFLYWKHDNEQITFEIHFKNSKWALFGLKNTLYSDVIVTWLNDDKTGHFSDRKLTNELSLTVDSKQDWLPLKAFTFDEFTVVKFNRFIKLNCSNESNTIDLIENL